MFAEITQCRIHFSFRMPFFFFNFIFFKLSWSYATLKVCVQPWVSPHHLDVGLWGGMWSLRCTESSQHPLQEADIWWVSFWKMIINMVFLLYRKFWPLLAYNYSLKAKSITSCCCRGLTFVLHTHGHVHTDSLSTILLHQCLQGLRRAFFGGCSRHFAWLGHEGALTTAMQDASSPPQPPEGFLQCPKGCCVSAVTSAAEDIGFWEFVSLLALLRRC